MWVMFDFCLVLFFVNDNHNEFKQKAEQIEILFYGIFCVSMKLRSTNSNYEHINGIVLLHLNQLSSLLDINP